MNEVVIVAATRTAIGSFQGALSAIPATELGAAVIRRLLEQTGLDAAQIDEVILGQVLTAGAGQNPARQTAIKAGLPHTTPAMTLNKVCGSGLKAVQLAVQAIRCGDAELIIAGGQENMSLAHYVCPRPAPACAWVMRNCDSVIRMACGMRSTTTTWASPPRTWRRSTSLSREAPGRLRRGLATESRCRHRSRAFQAMKSRRS